MGWFGKKIKKTEEIFFWESLDDKTREILSETIASESPTIQVIVLDGADRRRPLRIVKTADRRDRKLTESEFDALYFALSRSEKLELFRYVAGTRGNELFALRPNEIYKANPDAARRLRLRKESDG